MGLNCGCPEGAHLADLVIPDCKEGLGQIQKVIIQRINGSAGVPNKLTDPTKKASYTPMLSAADGTKMIITPYIQNPTSEPGAARVFGGGNQTLGGVEIVVGRESSTFNAIMYEESQAVIAVMKSYMCENVGVYLIDDGGNIGCITETTGSDSSQATVYKPIPIGKLFIGDKKLGGFEEPDSNTIEWSFFPNWSDKLSIVKRSTLDFNPLTDLVNAASA